LCAFLEFLLGNGPEYDFDDIDCYSLSRMCFHIDGDGPVDNAPELMPLDQSPRSHVNYLWEKVACLHAWQVYLEAVKAELERQRQELA
jgi:hypothetical protein